MINHVFIRDQSLDACFGLNGNLAGAAKFGFVGITGGLSAGGEVDFLYSPAGGARIGLLDLYNTITTDPTALGTPTLTGAAQFHVDNIAVNASGINLGLPTSIPAGQHQITVGIPNYANPLPELSLNAGLLAGLNNLKDMDFDDVLAALQTLAQSLVNMAQSKLLGVEIPGVGLSAGDLLGFAEDFLELVQEMQLPQNRADALEALQAKLQTGLNTVLPGVTPTLNMLFQNQGLEFQFDFTKNITKNIDLNVNLGAGFRPRPARFGASAGGQLQRDDSVPRRTHVSPCDGNRPGDSHATTAVHQPGFEFRTQHEDRRDERQRGYHGIERDVAVCARGESVTRSGRCRAWDRPGYFHGGLPGVGARSGCSCRTSPRC